MRNALIYFIGIMIISPLYGQNENGYKYIQFRDTATNKKMDYKTVTIILSEDFNNGENIILTRKNWMIKTEDRPDTSTVILFDGPIIDRPDPRKIAPAAIFFIVLVEKAMPTKICMKSGEKGILLHQVINLNQSDLFIDLSYYNEKLHIWVSDKMPLID